MIAVVPNLFEDAGSLERRDHRDLFVVVGGDCAAEGNAAKLVHPVQDGGRVGAANVVKETVDAVRSGNLKI